MDFFTLQDKARRRTKWLVFYYILAVIMTWLAIYALFAVLFGLSGSTTTESGSLGQYSVSESGELVVTPKPLVPVYSFFSEENLILLAFTFFSVLLVVGGGSLYKTSELSSGGCYVAHMMGGEEVDPNTQDPLERRLVNVVEEMAIASGVQVPGIYVMRNEQGLNAFAAGYTIQDAAVCVTRGTLEYLNRDELQGVIGHEFSHILNGDMRFNIRLIGILFGLQMIGLIGWGLLRNAYLFGGSSRSSKDGGGSAAIVIFAIGLGIAIIGAIGMFFCALIQAAISRQREYLADASAVERSYQGH